jgi:8-oxo-dGTP diphosphatase
MSHAALGGKAPILVVAAVLVEPGRGVLLSRRKAGSHLAGSWEFPGGKVEIGEDPRAALVRELAEELGIEAIVGDPVEITFHAYPERSVLLLFFEATRTPSSPEPRALDVAEVRWAAAHELSDEDFPPADLAVLAKVRARLGGASTRG